MVLVGGKRRYKTDRFNLWMPSSRRKKMHTCLSKSDRLQEQPVSFEMLGRLLLQRLLHRHVPSDYGEDDDRLTSMHFG